ncbi:hypothetical protein IW262DRAFT_1387494 [Armillaria fumosa]|nr:hypothetical protein IW262DRAFT_1387494 [Armillaria fumosa]
MNCIFLGCDGLLVPTRFDFFADLAPNCLCKLSCLVSHAVIGRALCSNLWPSTCPQCLVYSLFLINITYAYTIKPSLGPVLPYLDLLWYFRVPSVLLYSIFLQGCVQIAVRKYICYVVANLTSM